MLKIIWGCPFYVNAHFICRSVERSVLAGSVSTTTCSGNIRGIRSLPRANTAKRFLLNIFLNIVLRAIVCWPLLCLCRPFCIFEKCLDSNPETCSSRQARYKLSHPSPYQLSRPSPFNLATHLPPT
jgi:hypothetical protein